MKNGELRWYEDEPFENIYLYSIVYIFYKWHLKIVILYISCIYFYIFYMNRYEKYYYENL